MTILMRWAAVAAAISLLAGCAKGSDNVLAGLAPVSPANASGIPGLGLNQDLSQDPTKKTLASKMLTAIALERVTGRKPDPSRLSEL